MGLANSRSVPITSDEVGQILRKALDVAKEVHRQARKAGWIARTLPTGDVPSQREYWSSVQAVTMKELATAATRYGDFLLLGKIPGDLKAEVSSRRASHGFSRSHAAGVR